METLFRDLKYAALLLRRNPLFAATAILSLAISIGANTAIFTITNALVFRDPTGVVEPDRLLDIMSVEEGGGPLGQHSYPNYRDIRERVTTLQAIYGYQLDSEPMSLGGRDGAERVFGKLVTANYFGTLGVRPAVGRLFGPADREEPGTSPIVVLSYGFWLRRFNGDPTLVGKTLQLNRQPLTIVGVAAEGFQGTNVVATDLWLPTAMAGATRRGNGPIFTSRETGLLILGGRLKPGISPDQARTELEAIGRALEREHPNENRGKRLLAMPLSPIPGNVLPVAAFLGLLTGIVSIVLLIACANVAGVLLARAIARRREIAVRVALGVGRKRLIQQLMTEAVVLFFIGASVGVLLARVMTSLLTSLIPALPVPVNVALTLDARVIAFTSGISLLAALLCGLAPALRLSKDGVVSVLKEESLGFSSASRLRNVFVVGQVAFTCVLIVGTGLLLRALERASSVDPGFDPSSVELVDLDLSLGGYDETTGPRVARELVQRISEFPDVRSATAATFVPMGGGNLGAGSLGGLTVPGVSPPNGQPFFMANWNLVEPAFFATMQIPLVAGRDFTTSDAEGAPLVAILGEATARRFWPGQTALGKYLQWQPGRVDVPNAQRMAPQSVMVIGVARDPKYRSLGERVPPLFLYAPLQQHYMPALSLVARATYGRRIGAQIGALIAATNSRLPIVSTRTADDGIALSLIPQRVAAWVTGTLGLVGLLLAAMGVYGVTAQAVTRRTREIGIRLVLGAQRAEVLKMVLRQGMLLVGVGAAIGLILAAVASQLLSTLLFGMPPLDPVTFSGAAVLFAAIGFAACYLPALRATQIRAMEALRHE